MSGVVLAVRRGLTQLPLLAAVLAVVLVVSALVGLCTLLLTAARDEAVVAAVRATDPADLRVKMRFAVETEDAGPVRAEATATVSELLGPQAGTQSVWLTSALRQVGGTEGDAAVQAYLLAADGVAERAALVDGRWPGEGEVAVPAVAADRLAVGVGDALELPGEPDLRLVVSGVYEPVADDSGTWAERDLLGGAGFHPDWASPTGRARSLPTYGPFVVDRALLDEVPVERVDVWFDVDLSGVTAARLDAVAAALASADGRVTSVVGDRGTYVVVTSRLPRTVADVSAQQRVTGAIVLVVGLVGLVLSVAALALAGRLIVARRSAEAGMLVARGARRTQLAGMAALEALVLAGVGAVAAPPLALAAYRRLVHLVPGAGLTGSGGVTRTLVIACGAAAALLAAVLVVPWLLQRHHRAAGRRPARGLVARSGADVVLLALAVLGYLELRRHALSTSGGADPVLVAAPVLCLLAGAVLALRLVPVVARLAERHATRSRHLVLPLASWQVSRRAHSVGAAFLMVLATAAATFGVAFDATWRSSQQDQAEARVGADVAVLAGPGGLPTGPAVAVATGGRPSPVTRRAVGLRMPSDDGAPVLVAVDSARPELLRGRLPAGLTWAGLVAGLAPETPVTDVPLTLDDGIPQVTLAGRVGTATPPAPIDDFGLVPTLVLQDAVGGRWSLTGEPMPLDGEPRPFAPALGEEVEGPVTLVAVALELRAAPEVDLLLDWGITEMAPLALEVTIPAADATGGWAASQLRGVERWLQGATATLEPGDGGASVRVKATIVRQWLGYEGGRLLISAFPRQPTTPVAVTADVASALAVGPGDGLTLGVGTASIDGLVTQVIPYAPSAPGRTAVLVDYDALSRAALLGGELAPLTDAWWLADVAEPEAAGAGVGVVQTPDAVASVLRDGPLRVGVAIALLVLVVAALGLALAGTALDTAAALDARAVEVARLQGLGVSRRATLASLLAEYATTTGVVVTAGAVVGAGAAWLIGPLLAVAEDGRVPVPAALPVWPWGIEGALLVGLPLACLAVVTPVAAGLVRRAAVRYLRVGGGS